MVPISKLIRIDFDKKKYDKTEICMILINRLKEKMAHVKGFEPMRVKTHRISSPAPSTAWLHMLCLSN